MTKHKTARGFPFISFKDFYERDCSVQISSLADEMCIWVGLDGAEPKVLAKNAAKYGIKTNETTGWVPFPVPDEVLLSTKMHLNTKQVKDLIKVLQKWVDTGEIY